jgi:hypothetical protein
MLEQGLDALKYGVSGAHHEQRLAALGVTGESSDRSVREGHAFVCCGRREPIGHQRIDRAHVDQRRARPRVCQHPIGARDHFKNGAGRRQHREDDVTGHCHIGHASRPCTEFRQRATGDGFTSQDDDIRSLANEIRRHAACPCFPDQ